MDGSLFILLMFSLAMWKHFSLMKSCLIVCLFFIFIFFIALARTSSVVLNRNGESELRSLVPDIKGNTFNFTQLGICLL